MRKMMWCWLLSAVVLVSAVHAQSGGEKMPRAVFVTAEDAEDIISFYLQNDWTGADILLKRVGRYEAAVEQEMQKKHMNTSMADVFGFLVFRLKSVSNEKKEPLLAALIANQITALLIDLQSTYTQAIPIEIAWMDYLGREIVLLARLPNSDNLLDFRVSELIETWNKVKPSVQAQQNRKAEDIAARVDRVLASLRGGKKGPHLVSQGNRILDLVDELEVLFK